MNDDDCTVFVIGDVGMAKGRVFLGKIGRDCVCVPQMTVSLMSLGKKTLFGKGNLEMLRHKISKDEQITAVFLSVNMLTRMQHR
ncbi:hypothetical protein PR048_016055 [Dryococelus australis]|uniref:Uncharacterized protein n=1 Tax=Dryococelus australis TaxID=614101 RepID=A0ABQ9HJU0_9NEOP|nr:hypothetical protein PR048_016055 [Dryococelus australis]